MSRCRLCCAVSLPFKHKSYPVGAVQATQMHVIVSQRPPEEGRLVKSFQTFSFSKSYSFDCTARWCGPDLRFVTEVTESPSESGVSGVFSAKPFCGGDDSTPESFPPPQMKTDRQPDPPHQCLFLRTYRRATGIKRMQLFPKARRGWGLGDVWTGT